MTEKKWDWNIYNNENIMLCIYSVLLPFINFISLSIELSKLFFFFTAKKISSIVYNFYDFLLDFKNSHKLKK